MKQHHRPIKNLLPQTPVLTSGKQQVSVNEAEMTKFLFFYQQLLNGRSDKQCFSIQSTVIHLRQQLRLKIYFDGHGTVYRFLLYRCHESSVMTTMMTLMLDAGESDDNNISAAAVAVSVAGCIVVLVVCVVVQQLCRRLRATSSLTTAATPMIASPFTPATPVSAAVILRHAPARHDTDSID